MKKLRKIYEELLPEYHTNADGEINYEIFERIDDFKVDILNNFLYKNNEDYTMEMPWRLISAPRLKRIWENWIKFGFVRDEKGLQMIEDVMISNTIKIDVITTLTGHSSEPVDEYYEDAWGEHIDSLVSQFFQDNREDDNHNSNDPSQLEFDWNSQNGDGKKKIIPNPKERVSDPYLENYLSELNPKAIDPTNIRKELMEKLQGQFFWYYVNDPKCGHMRISDYGLAPLQKLAGKLLDTYDSAAKVPVIDAMLNVVHQRSDLASWYVQGGSNALSDLSASPSEREKEKNS